VTALVRHLHGAYHRSYRAIADLLADIADLPIGLGSVVTCTERVSTALVPVNAAIHTALQTQAVVNLGFIKQLFPSPANGHAERSEASRLQSVQRSFASLRMTTAEGSYSFMSP
jgi:hypothetical protein